jgi:hypothetical protein
MLNARNEHDRSKFVEDLKEAILEVCSSGLVVHPRIELVPNGCGSRNSVNIQLRVE